MKKITNPIQNSIYIVYNGIRHDIEAGESVVKDDNVTEYWLKQHEFILVEDISDKEFKEAKKGKVVKQEDLPPVADDDKAVTHEDADPIDVVTKKSSSKKK